MDLKKIYEWADEGMHKKIISEIEKLPKNELSFDLNNQLARAYNNISEYDQAIKLLLSQIYDGKGDAYWNYVIGYAFYHKNDKVQALRHFEKSFDLGRNDTKYWLNRCKLSVNGIDGCELKTLAEIYKDFGLIFRVSPKSKTNTIQIQEIFLKHLAINGMICLIMNKNLQNLIIMIGKMLLV